eukprot:gene10801-13222_t
MDRIYKDDERFKKFKQIEYLNEENATSKQKQAYNVINELGIMKDLSEYTPTLCGTIPISIDIEGSDLDIIMEVHDFNTFNQKITDQLGYDKDSSSQISVENPIQKFMDTQQQIQQQSFDFNGISPDIDQNKRIIKSPRKYFPSTYFNSAFDNNNNNNNNNNNGNNIIISGSSIPPPPPHIYNPTTTTTTPPQRKQSPPTFLFDNHQPIVNCTSNFINNNNNKRTNFFDKSSSTYPFTLSIPTTSTTLNFDSNQPTPLNISPSVSPPPQPSSSLSNNILFSSNILPSTPINTANNTSNSSRSTSPSLTPPPPTTPSPSQSPNPFNNQITPTTTTTTTTTSTTSPSTPSSPYTFSSNNKNKNGGGQPKIPLEDKTIHQLIMDLYENEKREETLNEISKRKDSIGNLAVLLWYTPCIISIFIQEILSIYKYISAPNPKLKARASNRVCNTLNILQIIASDPQTKMPFVKAKLVWYIYPFLNTTSKSKPFEYLRFSSLSVISALLKTDSQDIISFLIESDISTPCLKIMETGSELSKTVSTFILQKILNEDEGLNYFTQSGSRLQSLFFSLNSMIEAMLPTHMSSRLLKHIVRCYLRLSDSSKARESLPSAMPECFSNGQLNEFLQKEGDVIVKRWFTQLMGNVYPQFSPNRRSTGGFKNQQHHHHQQSQSQSQSQYQQHQYHGQQQNKHHHHQYQQSQSQSSQQQQSKYH